MKNNIVDKLLSKLPISEEIRDTIRDNVDLTQIISREVVGQIMGQGDKLKEELKGVLARELGDYLRGLAVEKILKNTLEDMEVEVKVTFKRKR